MNIEMELYNIGLLSKLKLQKEMRAGPEKFNKEGRA
jgi:hypothetical protein